MRLVLVIASLGGGGAERVISCLANSWAERGHEVSLITLDRVEGDVYPLADAVKRVGLDQMQPAYSVLAPVRNNACRVSALRRVFREMAPDIIISFMTSTNVLARIASIRLGCPVVLSERNEPELQNISRPWRLLRRLVVPRADAVVVQTERIAQWWQQYVPRAKIRIIGNPVQIRLGEVMDDACERAVHWAGGRPMLLAAGRLTHQKGFDLLIQAFAQAAEEVRPEWCLVILGEGALRSSLERIVQYHGLAERVLLPGFSSTPHEAMASASIFALSSRFEGMPNVLLEAMACGLPVVSFDCPTGPSELIEHDYNGLLIEPENSTAFASSLRGLMADKSRRERIAMHARTSGANDAGLSVVAEWESLLIELVSKKQAS